MDKDTPDNRTLVERIMGYLDCDQDDKAKALALTGDYLEGCHQWEISFDNAIDQLFR